MLVIRSFVKANCSAAAEELSEEDQQLKNELDMLVERLTVCAVALHLI